MRSSHSVDLTKGSVTKKLLLFTIPILLSGVLQHLYTMADRVVVGNFAENGKVALAAVSSTGSATTLILNLFLGVSVGANVICSNYRGARMVKDLRKAMHTSLILAAIFGIVVGVAGFFLAKPILQLMDTPENVLGSASLYMRLYFVGVPASLIYNFGAAIIRAHGDTKRPMYILAATGIVNVALNLVLVIGAHWDVAGVAVATIAAQYSSAAVVLVILFNKKGEYHLTLKELRLHGPQVRRMITVGVPCGINGIVFSISNVIVQSSVNSFNDAAIMAGSGVAADISAFVYLVIAGFYSACISFSGQCSGAKLYKRVDKLVGVACLWCTVFVCAMATVITLFPEELMSLYNRDPDVINAGKAKMLLITWGYILYGVSEVFLGCLRGMGHSSIPTSLNVFGICVPRLLWVLLIFPMNRDFLFLFLCYPISWVISSAMQMGYYFYCRRKQNKKRLEDEQKAQRLEKIQQAQNAT